MTTELSKELNTGSIISLSISFILELLQKKILGNELLVKLRMFFWQPPQPSYLHHGNTQECWQEKEKRKWKKQEGITNYESWKALPSSFRNDCSLIPPSCSQQRCWWLIGNCFQTKLERLLSPILGRRASVGWGWWDQGPPPGQRAITQRAHKTHISTSISAASMRHFRSLPWKGTLKSGSSFRKVKRRSLQVNDHLYQEHQQTCTESHSSQPGRCRRLTWGKCNRTRFDHVPSGGFQVRWESSKNFSQLRWNSFTSRQVFMKSTLTALFKIPSHSPTSNP